jgi:hypothetical protein
MASDMAAASRVGDRAPDFTPHSTPDQTLSLPELRGHPVILTFHPADWNHPMALKDLLVHVDSVPNSRTRLAPATARLQRMTVPVLMAH